MSDLPPSTNVYFTEALEDSYLARLEAEMRANGDSEDEIKLSLDIAIDAYEETRNSAQLLAEYEDYQDRVDALIAEQPREVEYNFFFADADRPILAYNEELGLEYQEVPRGRSPFVDQFEGYVDDDSYRSSKNYASKRTDASAPLQSLLVENSLARQLSEKKDQPATIRLIRRKSYEEMATKSGESSNLPWDSLIPPNTKFFLEQVSESREEKVQILETFGEWVAFFFGRKPEIYSYSGTLLNAKNHDWKNDFHFNYDNFLRGSQAVKNRATMILQYDDVIVEGYMLNCSISQSAQADKSIPFQFTLLIINRSTTNPAAALSYRGFRSGFSELEAQIHNDLQAALNGLETGGVTGAETFFLIREYFAGNYKPPAGTTTFQGGVPTNSSESVSPGAIGGTCSSQRLGPSVADEYAKWSEERLNKISDTAKTLAGVPFDYAKSIYSFILGDKSPTTAPAETNAEELKANRCSKSC